MKVKNEFIKSVLFKRGDKTRPVTFHAYDLETTLIPTHSADGVFPGEATPKPLYITAYSEYLSGTDRAGEDVYDQWVISKPITKNETLCDILIRDFLTDDKVGQRFVAWNGNNFDAYFIGMALLNSEFVIRPYITKSNAIRGLKIIDPADNDRSWEFLDGIAMTGVTAKLRDFVKAFAPSYEKLNLDFSGGTTFDANNPDHRAYALRDSVGLYYALKECDRIVEILTQGMHLTPTIGNLGIKYFTKMMPEAVYVRKPIKGMVEPIHYSLKRGGYCYLQRRYKGPVWKYDINQAYAAAMRECALPAGRMMSGCGVAKVGECAMYRVRAYNDAGTIPPFYWKHSETAKAYYSNDISDAWITSDEFRQIKREGWNIDVLHAYFWDDAFSMVDMVDRLEELRTTSADGPGGPVGTMCKSLGNNAYGKTAEQLGNEELLMASECPDGFLQWSEDIPYIWCRVNDERENERGYHQPQIAAFITAYVRMVVRRAIISNFNDWIYADTDCVVFSSPADLPIDKKIYGKWKQETDGDIYSFIVKKGYYSMDKTTVHCKGMNIRNADGSLKFTDKQLSEWWDGKPPNQNQTQRNNLISVVAGNSMYKGRNKNAQKIPKTVASKK